jgi:hypothetical protein
MPIIARQQGRRRLLPSLDGLALALAGKQRMGIRMKKSTSVLALAAVVGLSALTATSASAAPTAYPNCKTAAAAGEFNIPIGSPGYGPHLDRDNDGIGCESSTAGGTAQPAPAPADEVAPAPSQVTQLPVGGADTGVTQKTDNGMEILVLGGLVVAAASGTVIVRRRMANQA